MSFAWYGGISGAETDIYANWYKEDHGDFIRCDEKDVDIKSITKVIDALNCEVSRLIRVKETKGDAL